MELVDANTKNYVFLTLSQYNDQQELVRTRVSMRRDQPFWDGGNSYICCESFRISASPSQGGLYYKVFPFEWYMGCQVQPAQDTAPDNTDDAWDTPLVPPTGGDPHEVGQVLVGGDVNPLQDDSVLSVRLNVWSFDTQGGIGEIDSNDPRVVRTRLEQYLNQFFLWDRSWTRLRVNNGNDNQNPGWIMGRCQGNPGLSIVGSGLGKNKLYYPEIGCASPSTAAVELTALSALTKVDIVDHPITLTFKAHAQPGTGENEMPDDEMRHLMQNGGKNLHIQVRQATTPPRDWSPLIKQGIFNVLGLYGVEYHFEQKFFVDMPNDDGMATCTGAPYRPMQYSSLSVGSQCWIVIDADDAKFDAGTYYGTITKVPGIDSDGYTQSTLTAYLQGTPELYDLLKSSDCNDAAKRIALCGNRWMISTSNEAVNAAIHANMNIDVLEGSNSNLPAFNEFNNFFRNNPPYVQFAKNRHDNKQMCIRRPDQYFYTPNEMFYAFNQTENVRGQLMDLPYKLQTSENGGFKIWWQQQNAQSNSFEISVSLSEALGLNPYFEYKEESHVTDVGYNMAYVQKVNFNPQLSQYDEPAIWINQDALSLEKDRKVAIPMPPPAGVGGGPLAVWDNDGVEYEYIRNWQYVESQFENVSRFINPTTHEDPWGNMYYRYDNLPKTGFIGNTQMVSVESFSTYSEITIVIPNLPFQSMLGTSSDERILASLRLPFGNGTNNNTDGAVMNTTFDYYGDLIFNTLPSRSYLKVTTDQALYDCDVEVRLIRRDGQMDVMQLPYQGEFQVKLRLLQTQ